MKVAGGSMGHTAHEDVLLSAFCKNWSTVVAVNLWLQQKKHKNYSCYAKKKMDFHTFTPHISAMGLSKCLDVKKLQVITDRLKFRVWNWCESTCELDITPIVLQHTRSLSTTWRWVYSRIWWAVWIMLCTELCCWWFAVHMIMTYNTALWHLT
jgi:hypothetical protein